MASTIHRYYVFSDYIEQAMARAEFTQLEDGITAGKIPCCKGVVAFGGSAEDCQEELQSLLESWILTRLKLGHSLPVIHGINLNKEVYHV